MGLYGTAKYGTDLYLIGIYPTGSGAWVTKGSGLAVSAFYRLNNPKYTDITSSLVGAVTTDATGKYISGKFNTTGYGGAIHILRDAAGGIIQVDNIDYTANYITDLNGFIRVRSHHFRAITYDPKTNISGEDAGNFQGQAPGYLMFDLQVGQITDFVLAGKLLTKYENLGVPQMYD
jgi:hypothetical protein